MGYQSNDNYGGQMQSSPMQDNMYGNAGMQNSGMQGSDMNMNGMPMQNQGMMMDNQQNMMQGGPSNGMDNYMQQGTFMQQNDSFGNGNLSGPYQSDGMMQGQIGQMPVPDQQY